jgi:hypothetical protein
MQLITESTPDDEENVRKEALKSMWQILLDGEEDDTPIQEMVMEYYCGIIFHFDEIRKEGDTSEEEPFLDWAVNFRETVMEITQDEDGSLLATYLHKDKIERH